MASKIQLYRVRVDGEYISGEMSLQWGSCKSGHCARAGEGRGFTMTLASSKCVSFLKETDA